MQPTREKLFEILVREHTGGLLAFVFACIADRHAAQDIAQEVFIVAWQRIDEYDADRPFSPWLRKIAKHKLLQHFRDQSTARRHVVVLSPEQIDGISREFDHLAWPARGDTFAGSFAALKECLAALAAEDQEIVRQAYQDSQPCRSIAAALGHTVEVVKKRLQRARAALHDCILSKIGSEAANG